VQLPDEKAFKEASKKAAEKALVCWLSATLLSVGVLVLFLGLPSADGGIEAITRITLEAGLPALFSWLGVRKRTPPCSWSTFILRYMGWFLLLAFLLSYGQISDTLKQINN